MKKFLLFSLLLSFQICANAMEYEDALHNFWKEAFQLLEVPQDETPVDLTKSNVKKNVHKAFAFLPQDPKKILTEASSTLTNGGELLMAFYPNETGFDLLLEKQPVSIENFRAHAHSLGFEILYFMPERHMATFNTQEELETFLQNHFQSTHHSFSEIEMPLMIPTKLIITLMKKSHTE